MSSQITAPIIHIFPTEQVKDNFRKREFVVYIDGRYPQEVKMQATQNTCDTLDKFKVGDVVTVSFELTGRPYEKDGKKTWFTNVNAWRIERESVPSGNQPAAAQPSTETRTTPDFDDVPF